MDSDPKQHKNKFIWCEVQYRLDPSRRGRLTQHCSMYSHPEVIDYWSYKEYIIVLSKIIFYVLQVGCSFAIVYTCALEGTPRSSLWGRCMCHRATWSLLVGHSQSEFLLSRKAVYKSSSRSCSWSSCLLDSRSDRPGRALRPYIAL